MTANPNDQPNPNLGGVRGREATPEEIARRDGYVKGRTDENYVQGGLRSQERVAAQAQVNDSAASGMIIGITIAVLAALVGAALYFLTGDRNNVAPVAVPQIERERTIEKETTVIEREVPSPDVSLPDVQVDVPDVQVNVPEVPAPDVNITNEAPAPAAEPKAEEPAEAVEAPAAAQ